MKKLVLYSYLLIFFNCQKADERCGQIIQKVFKDNNYYFVLQTDDYANSYGDPNLPGIPDDGVRQGSVTQETFEAFKVGDDYCSDN